MFGEPERGFTAMALAVHLDPAAELQMVGPTQTSGDITCAQGPGVAACLITNDKGSVEIGRWDVGADYDVSELASLTSELWGAQGWCDCH